MKRLAPIVFSIVLGIITPVIGQSGDVSQRFIKTDIPGTDFSELILMIAKTNKLPTGFQQTSGKASPECEKKRDVLFPKGVHVRMFMTAVMDDCPGYSWSGGNVLSVFPTPKEDSVLDVVVPELAVEDLSAEEILDRIFASPAVVRYLNDKKISRDVAYKGLSTAVVDPRKYRFAFNNKSVRDMLDQIVTTTGYKVWIHQGPTGPDRTINVRIF